MLAHRPRRFKVSNPKAAYAVVIIVGGDSDLAKQMAPDISEMVQGHDDRISVLLLLALPGVTGAVVAETGPTGIRVLDQLNRVSTGDPQALSAFLARALVSYSRETRFALGFWGHGQGVYGDHDAREILLPAALIRQALPRRPRRRRRRGINAMGMLPSKTSGDILTNREARSALAAAFARAERSEPMDIIFSDTCLNGSVEVYTELREFALAVIASSLLVSGDGWNYTYWLQTTARKMPANAEEWSRCALAAYSVEYPEGGARRAQLAAFSTEVDLVKSFAKIVKALLEMDKDQSLALLAAAGCAVPPIHYQSNLDLRYLVMNLMARTEPDSTLHKACSAFIDSYFEALIGLSHDGDIKLGGLTIWCPLDGDPQRVDRYYGKLQFAKKTKWFQLLKKMAQDD